MDEQTKRIAEIKAYLSARPPNRQASFDRFTNQAIQSALDDAAADLTTRIRARKSAIDELQESLSRRQRSEKRSPTALEAVYIDLQNVKTALSSLEEPANIDFPPATSASTSSQPPGDNDDAFKYLLSIRSVLDDIATSRTAIPVLAADLDVAKSSLEHEQTTIRELRMIESEIAIRTDRSSRKRKQSQNKDKKGDVSRRRRPGSTVRAGSGSETDGGEDSGSGSDDEDGHTARARTILARREEQVRRLESSLASFIDDQLSRPLELEDQGKAVVGDRIRSGLTAATTTTTTTADNGPRRPQLRQRRIDELFGRTSTRSTNGGDNSDNDDNDNNNDDETDAGEELKRLINRLVDGYLSPTATTDEQYVSLDRESAPARFLVRAKIARFHPRYPLKIALVPFAD